MAVLEVKAMSEIAAAMAGGQKGVLMFYATWQDASAEALTRERSRPGGQLHQLLEAMAQAPENAAVRFFTCEAEAAPELSLKMGVEMGNPKEPRCKFSRAMVELLKEQKVAFGSFDILGDEEVRQGLKRYSDWPTYPQLYCRGELLGGLDVVKEMAQEEGGLVSQLDLGNETDISNPAGAGADAAAGTGTGAAAAQPDPAAAQAALEERLRSLVGGSPAMLFMKGNPDAPRCGFSRRIVELLREEGWDFGYFDILQDNAVREGLKKFSDWPTYPQLYVKGELVGGLDLVQEMKESGDLADLKP
eukprot:scaffold630_cov218-Pinguiococcus_pyrenoidosus.AAC.1